MRKIDERPWGEFETLSEGERFKLKTLTIDPGQRTSLQSHMHRREVWTVILGSAYVTIDGNEYALIEGQTVHVPLGAVHRIENKMSGYLMIAEVQIGNPCSEDDITRYSDDYGRALTANAQKLSALPLAARHFE